ncbi:MAG: vWA domain-containing protein [Saprospiraceae bacterium]|jgi:Ca-activated chloride channel family protein
MNNIVFNQPNWLFLLVLIPIFWLLYIKKIRRKEVRFSYTGLNNIPVKWTWRIILYQLRPYIRLVTLALIIVVLARPQHIFKEEEINAEGIDIVLAMDLSSSMLAQDFKPDRLEASKKVAVDFVNKRPYDRIGLTVFSGEAFSMCPLTSDHNIVNKFLLELECGKLRDGTAIGMGLATAINRLKESEAKSKVVILLTDGVNNEGYVKPITAAEIAKEFGIKVYTIGVGTQGDAMSPVSRRSDGRYIFGLARVEIDEELLRQIADLTGGSYYRATTMEMLEAIYGQIDELEKTKMEVTVTRRFEEAYFPWAISAIICLVFELFIGIFLGRIIL